MSLCKRDKPVTSAATDLRTVYGPNAAKKIGREWGVAVVTAKLWLAGRFPLVRRDELARRIVAELDRQDVTRAEIRRRWAGDASAETSAVDSDRVGVRLGRPSVGGPQAEPLGRKVSR